MKWLIVIVCFALYMYKDVASAQALEYQLLHGPMPSADDDTAAAPAAPRHRLLPANMSWMERALWDENGLVRKVGLEPALTPEERKSELGLRRTMLTTHQIGGFVTWISMAGAVVFGQRYLDHRRRSDLQSHKTFVTATIVSYSATGLLAVLSPPPLIRRENEVSTTTIHKSLAWVHFIGMVATPFLAQAIHRRSPNFIEQARFHQTAAYITFAALTASLITVTF